LRLTRITGFTAGAAVLGTIVVSNTHVQPQAGPAALQQATVDAFHIVFYVCAGCAVLALIIAAAFMVRGQMAGPGRAPAVPGQAPGAAGSDNQTADAVAAPPQ